MEYLTRRALTYVVVFIVMVQLVFFLPRLVPGNAATILASGKFATEQTAILTARFGLDKPIYVQYFLYLKGIFFTWPPFFGFSYQYYPEPVFDLLTVRLGWSLLLIISSFVLSTSISYLLAAFSSIKRGGRFEMTSLYSAITFRALPVYWVAMVLIWVFGVWLKWFPLFGNVAFSSDSEWAYIASIIQHAVLPVISMSTVLFAEQYLLLRGSAQEVLNSDYVSAAKTRGLSDMQIANSYVMRNSLLPFISIMTFSLATLISIEILVEVVFGYPGIGDLIVDAINVRDYAVLQGILFFVTVLVIIGGMIGDIIIVRLDPRTRKG
jgi:peptide/nickel transport system permease protein